MMDAKDNERPAQGNKLQRVKQLKERNRPGTGRGQSNNATKDGDGNGERKRVSMEGLQALHK